MSNPNIVPHLQDDKAYLICPRCQDMGHPNVEMRRDGHRFLCPLQHELDIHSLNRLQASGRKVDMVPLRVIENPSPNMVQAKFWIHPTTLALLQEKFAGRLIVTMDTFFNLLVSGECMFVTGPDVAKLRALGITKPADIIAAVEGMKELEEVHKALIAKLQPIFDAASVAQAGGGD